MYSKKIPPKREKKMPAKPPEKLEYIVRLRIPDEEDYDLALCSTVIEAKALAYGAYVSSPENIGARAVSRNSAGHENILLSFGIGQVTPEEKAYVVKHQLEERDGNKFRGIIST